ncbi:glycosyltransferase family 4 protein [Achromobacter ruhlandii]|uniref:glycosyltransferase family 4 protein n=1 Tax=Achromobacter ruhlandii TaxID=72557 RepID=UPI0006C27DAC|nr:glycosyltransferase family 4 protein [Achromobacter ruhlandii]AVC42496.1 glycosyltransferase family 1 protein [Achromobacter xylosoxidans]CUJ11507.1 GDP-mannose-dependent alpha-(1-6)-phosphatidylinositol monomannoside mannosyltransferase [Achromobacter ruhlandii]CUJ50631.1 GDP-mannose-dependent alpha-(1-6)-phosphatidylinositol monomannoside mannosyltransferase [Achromobacter ruhlandii]CUK00449.1 GDP-mannose-dependent alpha-(1-6)-phosphatidylinositol monomannoside mannosyltransferase [Achromo
MKILYTNFHQGDGGGHTTYVMSLARMLGGRADVTVAAPRGSRLLDEVAALPGVHTVALQFKGPPASQWRTLRTLRALLREQAYDVVHVNGSADHRLCMLAVAGMGQGRPFMVYTQHNGRHPRSLGTRLRAGLATDRVICVSQHTFEGMARSAFRPADLRLVRNGIDTRHYSPVGAAEAARAREQLLPPALRDRLVIGSHAGTAPYKNWLDMVAAVAALPESSRRQVAVLIAGQPPTAADMARVEALGMRGAVVYAGLLRDVRPLLAATDVGFVLSSRLETISFACRELMAAGKPVIVSDTGGLAENVTEGSSGWVVPAGSVARVTETLADILENRILLDWMAAAARRKAVRDFSLETFVRETERVYGEGLQARAPRLRVRLLSAGLIVGAAMPHSMACLG